MPELAEWDSFYVIVGSAAGALIGLQFVVMTLIAANAHGGGRPSIRHAHHRSFQCCSAPVRAAAGALAGGDYSRRLCGLTGLGGLAYAVIVTRRMRRQSVYKPDFEDWLFHAALPVAAYAALTLSSFAALSHIREALFGIGGAALLLLFTGIHNSWDAIAYQVFVARRNTDKGRDPSGPE